MSKYKTIIKRNKYVTLVEIVPTHQVVKDLNCKTYLSLVTVNWTTTD